MWQEKGFSLVYFFPDSSSCLVSPTFLGAGLLSLVFFPCIGIFPSIFRGELIFFGLHGLRSRARRLLYCSSFFPICRIALHGMAWHDMAAVTRSSLLARTKSLVFQPRLCLQEEKPARSALARLRSETIEQAS